MQGILRLVAQRLFAWYYTIYFLLLCGKNKNKNVVVAFGPAMGDVLFSLAYISSVTNEKKETLFLCTEKTAWLVDLFPVKNVKIKYMDVEQIKHMPAAYVYRPTNAVLKGIDNLTIANVFMYYSVEEVWQDKCGTLLSVLKDKAFRCESSTLPQRLHVPYKYVDVTIPRKSVLISPTSASSKGVDDSEWRSIIEWLRQNNYTVYTNCSSSNEAELPNTEKIVLDMVSIYNIIDRFDLIIGIRSGFQDFIIDRAKNIISINTGNMYPCFTLTQWETRANVREFRFKKETFLEDIINNVHDLRV